jgi:hypothetical protein
LDEAYVHDADAINNEWFTRRLPAIWGVRVVERGEELLREIKGTPS